MVTKDLINTDLANLSANEIEMDHSERRDKPIPLRILNRIASSFTIQLRIS